MLWLRRSICFLDTPHSELPIPVPDADSVSAPDMTDAVWYSIPPATHNCDSVVLALLTLLSGSLILPNTIASVGQAC